MSFLSSVVKKVKSVGSSVVKKSKSATGHSISAAKSTLSGTIEANKRLAKGDLKGSVNAKLGQHKASLRDTFKTGAEYASAANETRRGLHNTVTPKPIQKLEGKSVDEFNRFMGTDAGKILGYILKAIPVTAPYAWAYEAATFVAMAEEVRKMISGIKNMQDKLKLSATLESKKYVYDESVQAIRLAKEGDSPDMPEYRYVAARGGFLPIKQNNLGGLVTLGLLALGGIA